MLRSAASLLCVLFAIFAPQLIAADSDPAPTAAQIETWVKQLGDEDFSTRLTAEDKLRAAGESARQPLMQAAQSSDAEVKMRAERMLQVLKTEPVLRKLMAAVQTQNVESDLTMTMKIMNMAMDIKGHLKSTGDGQRFTMEMKVSTMGQEVPSRVVSDGTTMWVETGIPRQDKKLIQKYSLATFQKLQGGGSQNPMQSVAHMRQQYNFTDTKEEKLNGSDVIVLEGKLRDGAIERQVAATEEVMGAAGAQAARTQMEQMARSRIYFDKKDLMLRKLEVFDPNGGIVMSMELSNLKLDVKLDEKEFSYSPPAGERVMDMDEMFANARSGKPPVPQRPRPAPAVEKSAGPWDKSFNEAQKLTETGEQNKAIEVMKKAIADVEAKHGQDSQLLPEGLMDLALQYTYVHKDAEKIPLYERALKILQLDAEKNAGEIVYCLSTLGLVQQELERFDDAVKSQQRALDLLKKSKPDVAENRGLSIDRLEGYLADAKTAITDRETARKAVPEINGKAAPQAPATIVHFVADPKKSAEAAIKDGAKTLHEDEVFGVILKWHGVEHEYVKTAVANEHQKGYAFADGDSVIEFRCKSEETKADLIKQLGLKDPITLHARTEENTGMPDRTVFKSGQNNFINFTTPQSYYFCSNSECKSFGKRQKEEGPCPLCKKPLIFTRSWE